MSSQLTSQDADYTPADHSHSTIDAIARVDANARKLATRLESGDIAIIDFRDLDRATAQAFIAAGASAVLNAAPSMTGRYPNLGPQILLEAGIVLVDDLGPDIMTVKEGASLTIRGHEVLHHGRVVATGQRQLLPEILNETQKARDGFATQIQAFAATTGEYLERESPLVMSGIGLPELSVSLDNKVVLVVFEDTDAAAQLREARSWLNDAQPIVIAVDGGAAIAARAHLKPSVIIGDMELVPEKLLRSHAQLITGSSERYLAGSERIRRMGLSCSTVTTTALAPDLAIILAALNGAQAIVTVGDHMTFNDFLDRGRTGMAASFFTRLRAGGRIISLPTVIATYQPKLRNSTFIVMILAALLAGGAAFLTTPFGQDLLHFGVDSVTQYIDLPASSGSEN